MCDEKMRIEYNSIRVWRVTYLIILIVISIIAVGYAALVQSNMKFTHTSYMLLGILLLTIIRGIIFIPKIKYNNWKYNLSNRTLILEFGIFSRKNIVIPINRIQYVDTNQGIINRRYNLTDLTIFTAGGKITIPCISLQVADTLKNEISSLIAREETNESYLTKSI